MAQGRQNCMLLAVLCGQFADRPRKKGFVGPGSYVFPELVSAGRLEVQTLVNPTIDKFCEAQKLVQPNILYLQGSQVENEERIGSLVWGTVDVSEPEMLVSRISPLLPTIVYLELPNGEKIAQAFQSKGVPYVIYWKNGFTSYAASHFLHALLSVVQSSCSHTWDAFQLAHASFRLYCFRNNQVLLDNTQKLRITSVPQLLGDAPKINIPVPVKDLVEEVEEEEGSSETILSVKIYDEDMSMRILVCGVSGTLVNASLLSSLEDGLNALLNIEIRGSKLQNRVSATPPPLEVGNLSRGVVTMRCDIMTCSSAHISLLVSGSAQNCFNDQLLECQIKHALVEKSQLVHALPNNDESKQSSVDPVTSISLACGESTFEVCLKVPTWAAQVLKQLAPEVSYRSLVTLGIASVQGISVASFEKEDADRLLFFCRRPQANLVAEDNMIFHPPRWCSPLTKLRPTLHAESKLIANNDMVGGKGLRGLVGQNSKMEKRLVDGKTFPGFRENKLKIATMRPIPLSGKRKRLSFPGIPLSNANSITQVSANLYAAPPVKQIVMAPAPRRSMASSLRSKPMAPANPLPLKKHGCSRPPIQVCSEEEFLRDVMQFLVLRGHGRLVPQGGISEFPDVVLNAKRLDLYNLYREVVSRGGFYVGNGINWKGQVFSKMRNHTVTNRMTGVGNTLKRHYETYLLEYELAHDDVDGECCLICHSSAPGHWVNCGLCDEWAHFGCDRRQGLGTFKDYAKTDGLEYICPHCSLSDSKRKTPKMSNGVANTLSISRYA